MARLVVISNRVAIPEGGDKPPQGGLAVAVAAAMREREGLWFGWSGEIAPAPGELRRMRAGTVEYAVTDLCAEDFEPYYNGFANRALWPLLHYRADLSAFSSSDLQGYQRVNAFFADRVGALLGPDDVIWVHDYHLMPLARALRARGHRNRIGFFLHVPMPPPDLLSTLPRHESVIGALADYDLVGFQTENDAANFARYLTAVVGAATRDGRQYRVGEHSVRLGVFPVGIEPRRFARLAERALPTDFLRELLASLSGRHLLLGVDRLDYSKGILQRIDAFERFLESHTDWRARATFLQIAPRSRADIREYAEIGAAVSAKVGRLNGRFGGVSWVPMRYVNRNYKRSAIAGMMRLARVGIVTPLRDGMNLVAKEFVAAQDPADPGVLVLSQFAGAAAELGGALLVNPHDVDSVADAIAQALAMPGPERVARHREMMIVLEANDIRYWAVSFLAALTQPGRPLNWLSNRVVIP